MPRITEELVRRRAEHNNCEISTLEELSLHQQELERIEHLDRWCRGLKILYLQNNLIPRIENVGRLKQLQYLNLALNNIERIENLERCEILEKLDLTVNFVGDLLSVENLKSNIHFRQLYLTGNPCTDYDGYRDYVIATLPQLSWLDGQEVTRSERILAMQDYDSLQEKIATQQRAYEAKRERERKEHEAKRAAKVKRSEKGAGFDGRWYTDTQPHYHQSKGSGKTSNELSGSSAKKENTTAQESKEEKEEEEEEEEERQEEANEDEEDERFWNEPSPYTPESRTEVQQYMAEKRMREQKRNCKGPEVPKRVRQLERDGKMLNINEGRYEFHLREDDERNQILLEVAVPRFMDTSLVDCDLHPTYIRLNIKGKILQLVLPEEVSPDKSSVQRSQTTGSLLLTMTRAREVVLPRQRKAWRERERQRERLGAKEEKRAERERGKRESEEGAQKLDPGSVDYRNIVPREGERDTEGLPRWSNRMEVGREKRKAVISELGGEDGKGKDDIENDEDGELDDSDVPPLV